MTNSEQNVETDDSTVNEQEDSQEDILDQTDTSESNTSESNQELDRQLEDAQQQVAEYHDKMLRMQAEMDNLRKRTERDISNAHKYAVEKFANELLQVKDSLELGSKRG